MTPRLVVVWRRVAEAEPDALAPEEAALLSAAARPKRRAEFAAGRAAARAAAARLTGVAPESIVILRESGASDGRPYAAAQGGRRLGIELSITHADGIAIAAAGDAPLGVDVVAYEPMSAAFVEEAFAPGELDRWRDAAAGETAAVCAAFAAKEAALKWLGCGMRVPLRSVVVTPLAAPADAPPFRRAPVRVRAEALGRDAILSASWAELHGRVCMLLVEAPYGAWQTASTLLPSGSKTNAP